uniref:Uncharacterized protein n=1 Tax=uncultured bacterium fosmid pJB83B9 TaxID=1478070 RepID=A0A0H3U7U4_9BACT|nr:hypothetical protein [uncultured bacterium fosmid pJB83B9]
MQYAAVVGESDELGSLILFGLPVPGAACQECSTGACLPCNALATPRHGVAPGKLRQYGVQSHQRMPRLVKMVLQTNASSSSDMCIVVTSLGLPIVSCDVPSDSVTSSVALFSSG